MVKKSKQTIHEGKRRGRKPGVRAKRAGAKVQAKGKKKSRKGRKPQAKTTKRVPKKRQMIGSKPVIRVTERPYASPYDATQGVVHDAGGGGRFSGLGKKHDALREKVPEPVVTDVELEAIDNPALMGDAFGGPRPEEDLGAYDFGDPPSGDSGLPHDN